LKLRKQSGLHKPEDRWELNLRDNELEWGLIEWHSRVLASDERHPGTSCGHDILYSKLDRLASSAGAPPHPGSPGLPCAISPRSRRFDDGGSLGVDDAELDGLVALLVALGGLGLVLGREMARPVLEA
jgi:hypothetical protein